jgi:hypothetical protein
METSNYQLWVIEFYLSEIENSYMDLLTKYFAGNLGVNINPYEE